MISPVTIPLLNPNEVDAVLAALFINDGQHVEAGEVLCTLESTKSTAELEAEESGFVVGLKFQQGQNVRAGDILCYLSEDPNWQAPEGITPSSQASESLILPEGLRITQPALALALEHSIALDQLSIDNLVTESVVRAMIEKQSYQPESKDQLGTFDPTAILVYGGGGHGKALIDLLRMLGTYHIVGLVDDGMAKGKRVMDYPVLGGAEILPELYIKGVRLAVNAVGGIGNLDIRVKVFEKLAQAGFTCPAVVHPTAFVETSAHLMPGVQVMPQAYVGSEAHLDFGCIINSGAIVSHDCSLGVYTNIAPGAILAGEVEVGPGVLIGMGATINLQVKIGAGARIGNGATVKEDVPEKGVVKAGTIWPL